MIKKIIGGTILGIIIFSIVLGFIGKGVGTASDMADQTIFNADKHVNSYEQFRAKLQTYQSHKNVYNSITTEGLSGQELRNAHMRKNGAFDMMNRIAADYNTMATISYQAIWQGDLPERLELPIP